MNEIDPRRSAPPKVSVGIVAYNHADFITDCLESVRAQTCSRFEIIVADDCSKDNTVQIVQAYQKQYPELNIKLIAHDTNIGVTNNCNSLFREMNGEYVLFFAGDDIMLPDRLGKQVAALDANPEAPFCYSNCEWFQSETNKKLWNHFGLLQSPPKNMADVISDFTIPTPTIMMRRSAMPPYGFDQRLQYLSDFFMVVELMAKGDPVYLPEVLVRYRKHGHSLMATNFFLKDRHTLMELFEKKFDSRPDMVAALKNYRAIYGYALICDSLQKSDLKNALRHLSGIFPQCFSSIKWLARDAWMGRTLLKTLYRMVSGK